MKTSVSFTFRYLYEIPAGLEHSASVDEYAVNLAWAPAGREEEAISGLRDREKANPPDRLRHGVLVALRNAWKVSAAKAWRRLRVASGFHSGIPRYAFTPDLGPLSVVEQSLGWVFCSQS